MKCHAAATEHLRASDPVLNAVIDRVGPITLRPQRNRFWILVRSIVSQQISTQAAKTISARLEAMVTEPTAAALQAVRPARLRAAGISPQKARYLADLCAAVIEGRVDFARMARASDEEIVDQLVQVKGIGRWTAEMFLIFALGRPDVLPAADLGLRSALRTLYRLPELPDPRHVAEIAARWRPYATGGTWYCWRSLELAAAGPPRAATAQPRPAAPRRGRTKR